jgi:two-component system, sensor histidine kinase and response regulator
MEDRQDEAMRANARRIFEQQRQQIYVRTDRMFAALLAVEWVGGVIAALILSPKTWSGNHSELHPHVWLAIVLGGALATFPIALVLRFPGRMVTRHVIAVAQVLFSSLFIHISGGRIETHFHVFGSLAFLAFYRDWPVLIPATLVVAVDHFVRGVYWPETVFGIITASPYRWIEHAAWVVFEDIFLVISCRQAVQEMWKNARHTAELERMNADYRESTVELEQAYRSKNAIVETALDAVISMDIEGRITGWNSQAQQTFGWTAEEALGQPLAATIIPPRFRRDFYEGLRRYRLSGESVVLNRRTEMTAINREGEEFPIELAVAPIGSVETASFCAFVRDITEQQQAARALCRAKDAAEAANRAKSTFLAHMSHEIRTPLNGILGFADILLRSGAEVTEEERRDYLATINRSGRHLLELINDILDISKIESGQMDVERIRCAPHGVIAEVISILRARAQEKGIYLEYRWTSHVPETVFTDPSRLRQLLMNLIANAIKFTERGSVEVVARLEQSWDRPRLAIDVVDTGIGIAPEYVRRIFDPFTQADQSITRRFGGTGLGLSISRQIAELLGGTISVRSTLGRGSTFTTTIETGPLEGVRMLSTPAADLVPTPEPEASGPLPRLTPASILLVEDGATNRKLINLMLRRAGASVTLAENGQIGVDLALKQSFDLILMDMQMPVLDGYMASTELRRRGITIPIIALTAHSMKGDENRCRAAGCSGYLTKPIDNDRLISAVAEALGERRITSGEPRRAAAGDRERILSTLPMDDPEIAEAVEDFVERLKTRLADMRHAASERNFTVLSQSAHWLKGSAGTAGFGALTSAAAVLEETIKQGDDSRLAVTLEQIVELTNRIEINPLPFGDSESAEPTADSLTLTEGAQR